jgi:hypothetical protein
VKFGYVVGGSFIFKFPNVADTNVTHEVRGCLSAMTPSPVILCDNWWRHRPYEIIAREGVIAHTHVTLEWLDVFSWNLVWTLCYWGLFQTHTFLLPTLRNSIVMDTETSDVGGWRNDVITHDSMLWRYDMVTKFTLDTIVIFLPWFSCLRSLLWLQWISLLPLLPCVHR